MDINAYECLNENVDLEAKKKGLRQIFALYFDIDKNYFIVVMFLFSNPENIHPLVFFFVVKILRLSFLFLFVSFFQNFDIVIYLTKRILNNHLFDKLNPF